MKFDFSIPFFRWRIRVVRPYLIPFWNIYLGRYGGLPTICFGRGRIFVLRRDA